MFGGMLIIWVLIIGGIVWFVRYITDQKNTTGNELVKEPDAMEILKKQYVRGMISRDEFDERKKVIDQ
jgi:putative membrane protein